MTITMCVITVIPVIVTIIINIIFIRKDNNKNSELFKKINNILTKDLILLEKAAQYYKDAEKVYADSEALYEKAKQQLEIAKNDINIAKEIERENEKILDSINALNKENHDLLEKFK